ncbi:IclR family transcriptional regulator [Pseudomonas reidholzensis]|uniref:IclR family transcriptional regulator n=1 Tax=Pseudomonas reidholzensis TaxID=1785162 RepID=UPI001FC9E518|nr:IclR family transcriptional regulator C-terminal domain-containing protein [Pseudomonas reidholzensis]
MQSKSKAERDSGSLARGLAVLQSVVAAMRPVTLSEVSENVGLPTSTCHRLLLALVDSGHVFKMDASRYCPSPRSLAPLPLDHPLNMLRRDAGPLLMNLQHEHGASALLILFIGTSRLIVDFVPGGGHLAPYFNTLVESPLHASVSGKLLLGALPVEQREALLGDKPLERCTRFTQCDRELLTQELDQVSDCHRALNIDEHLVGIRAVGVHLMTPSQTAVGALVLSGAARLFEDRTQAMLEDLQQASRLLSDTAQSMRAVARLLNV